jgi:hypothetical protein
LTELPRHFVNDFIHNRQESQRENYYHWICVLLCQLNLNETITGCQSGLEALLCACHLQYKDLRIIFRVDIYNIDTAFCVHVKPLSRFQEKPKIFIYKVCSLHHVILLEQSFRSVSPGRHHN